MEDGLSFNINKVECKFDISNNKNEVKLCFNINKVECK